MIRIAGWCHDWSDSNLKRLCQLGVDCCDGMPLPTDDRGVFDLDEALEVKEKIHSWGMQVNRISLPNLSKIFIYRYNNLFWFFYEIIKSFVADNCVFAINVNY